MARSESLNDCMMHLHVVPLEVEACFYDHLPIPEAGNCFIADGWFEFEECWGEDECFIIGSGPELQDLLEEEATSATIGRRNESRRGLSARVLADPLGRP